MDLHDERERWGGVEMVARMSLALLLLINVGLAGCSTYRAASCPVAGEIDAGERTGGTLPAVTAGDDVKIVLNDGSAYKGRVLRTTSDVLTLTHGDHARAEQEPPVYIDVKSIASIERREGSPGKTFGLVVIILGGLVGALAIAVAAGGGMSVNFGG